jgi:multicomponent Na+:H+ antiporter subunit F
MTEFALVPWLPPALTLPSTAPATPTATVLLVGAGLAILVAVATLYRAVVGPTMPDRIVAVNVVGTTTVVVIALVAAGLGDTAMLDVALVYALLNFLLSVGLAKFAVARGGVL